MRMEKALKREAVPDPADLDALVSFGDELYQSVEPTDFADQDVLTLCARDCAPEFIALAEAAARAHDVHAPTLLQEAANALPRLVRLVFAEASDVALSSPYLIKLQERAIANGLESRFEQVRNNGGLQAYAYLQTLTRMGLVSAAAKFKALGLFCSIDVETDSDELLERLPRLAGMAKEQWNADELDPVLQSLVTHEVSKSDAMFELGQLALRNALEASTLEEIVGKLAHARDAFYGVERREEGRDDATLIRAALDIVLAFISSPRLPASASESWEELHVALWRRTAFSTRARLGEWAAPRAQAEIEWYRLSASLQQVIAPLGKPSWIKPIDTLQSVLAAYQASRSLTVISPEGIRKVLEPTIEAAFIRREGLLGHLKDVLHADELLPLERDAAEAILAATSSSATNGSDTPGKLWSVAPSLASELGLEFGSPEADGFIELAERAPTALALLNKKAEARARALSRESDPIVDDLISKVVAELATCEDFVRIETVREEFLDILTNLLRFAADRVDASRESWKDEIRYLFPPSDGKPFTEDFLQKDAYSWLSSSSLRPHIRMEERDIASGRADITIAQEHRFVVEVKRELKDSSRQSVASNYGGQAAAYSAAGPRLSIALILDLTDHAQGVPSLRESVWVDAVAIPNAAPRHVVTIVVRGNRQVPRHTKSG
ncbi:hypothetical protein [Arthrobacter sp. NtRootA1]|uniref:hypothetical protein n=1 Tax=Arthrobacter sp. NtRootA1 TaxID=2830983 RepID=UPI001CC530BD|nr:hypothetical protein [Arthrobacter sp. NtRootA1]BCW05662.1 hypothetical protein NtRootA1_18000 [Arthrobacter sp. NtRootA1]